MKKTKHCYSCENLSYIAVEARGITVGAVRRSWIASISLAIYKADTQMHNQ